MLQAELEAGRGVDIAIDCLGGETVGECLPYMNYGGRWIMIATLASDFTNVDLKSMYIRNTRLIGTTLRSRTPEAKGKILSDMVDMLWPRVEHGDIRPTIHAVFPIQDAEEAHRVMREGRNVGKLVLRVR